MHILSGSLWMHGNLLVCLLKNCSYVSCLAAVVFSHVSCIPAFVVVSHVPAYLLLTLFFLSCLPAHDLFICFMSACCSLFSCVCCLSVFMLFMCACCLCVYTPPVSEQVFASCISCLHAGACSWVPCVLAVASSVFQTHLLFSLLI